MQKKSLGTCDAPYLTPAVAPQNTNLSSATKSMVPKNGIVGKG